MDKGNRCALSLGMYTGAATTENTMDGLQIVKNRTTIWSSNSTSGYLYEENKNPYANYSIIYNSQDMEAI